MSTAQQPSASVWVPPPLRPDLVVSKQQREGLQVALIKDPLARSYFKLSAEDHRLACLLDGRRDCATVALLATADGLQTEVAHVQAVARALFERGLLVASTAFQKARHSARSAHASKAGWWPRLGGLLFARVPLLDPDALLTNLEAKLRWCWSRHAFRLYGVLCLGGLGAILVRMDELPRAFERSFNLPNLAVAWMLLVLVKVLHELGHGLTCKHYGGEVRELGLLVIVFSPFFYVNVTDSYLFPLRHQRILVAAAGIAVELVIAAVAAIAWALSRPGPAREVLFGLMMITSIWTVLFNANPLMKFDGYYILSDWTGVANLRARSMHAAMRVFDRLFFGSSLLHVDTRDGNKPWMAAFGLASLAYLLLVVAGIMALLRWLAGEVGLRWAGDVLALLLLAGMLGGPVLRYSTERFRWLKRRPEGITNERWKRRLAVGGTMIAFMLWLPVTGKTARQAVILPVRTDVVRAAIAGRLSGVQIKTGQSVLKGDVLMILHNPSLQPAVLAAESRVEAAHLAESRLLGAQSPGLLSEARAEFHAAQATLKAARSNLEKTVVRSPMDGLVVTEELGLQTGRGFRPGEILCEIVSDNQWEAHVPVEELSVDRLPPETPAQIRVRGLPNKVWESAIRENSHTEPFRDLPPSIAAALEKDLAVITGVDGHMVPVETYFGVRVPLPETSSPWIKPGMTGSVRFECGTRSLGSWLWQRWLEFVDPAYRL